MIYVVVPIYKEINFLKQFVRVWSSIDMKNIILVVSNAGSDDESSDYIRNEQLKNQIPIIEVPGKSNMYWSQLVANGLNHVSNIGSKGDFVLVTNVDVLPNSYAINSLLSDINLKDKMVIAAIAKHERCLSAGVIVKSWLFSINKHLFEGWNSEDITKGKLIEVTYLPTRFVLFPFDVLGNVGYPNFEKLPHYGGDYEYTNRMRLLGYSLYVSTSAYVQNCVENTGFKTSDKSTCLLERVKMAFNIKSTYNLTHRFWFAILVYPKAILVPALIFVYAKIVIEVLFGLRVIKKYFAR